MPHLLALAPFRNALLVRGAAVWVGVRILGAWGGVGDPNVLQEGFILLLVGGLVSYDARRRNEDLFLANLGVPAWAVGAVGVVGALPLELLVP